MRRHVLFAAIAFLTAGACTGVQQRVAPAPEPPVPGRVPPPEPAPETGALASSEGEPSPPSARVVRIERMSEPPPARERPVGSTGGSQAPGAARPPGMSPQPAPQAPRPPEAHLVPGREKLWLRLPSSGYAVSVKADTGYALTVRFTPQSPAGPIPTAFPPYASLGVDLLRLTLPADGTLELRFEGAAVRATLFRPDGRWDAVDAGYTGPLAAGDYYLQVTAVGPAVVAQPYAPPAGSAPPPQDPDRESGPDGAQSGATELRIPPGLASGEVDYDRGDRTDFWHLGVAAKGKLEVQIRQDPRTQIAVELCRPGEEFGQPLGRDGAAVDPGDYFLRVYAPGPGAGGRYNLVATFAPAKTLSADVIELEKGCVVVVDAGYARGVRPGMRCRVIAPDGTAFGACTVGDAMAYVSKLRLLETRRCSPPRGSRAEVELEP